MPDEGMPHTLEMLFGQEALPFALSSVTGELADCS